MSLMSFERRQAQAILEAYAPPRASQQGDVTGAPSDEDAGDAVKRSGERTVRVLAPRVGEVDYLRSVLRMMEASTGMARLGIHLGLFIAMWSPLWLCGRLRTMAGIPIEQRTEIMGRLLRHETFFVRELMLLLKIGASMALLGTASVRARSHYDRKREPVRHDEHHHDRHDDHEAARDGVRKLPVLSSRVSEVA